jgi:hypothetical protein
MRKYKPDEDTTIVHHDELTDEDEDWEPNEDSIKTVHIPSGGPGPPAREDEIGTVGGGKEDSRSGMAPPEARTVGPGGAETLPSKVDQLAWLVVTRSLTTPRRGTMFALEEDYIEIGRYAECTICLEDAEVSRHHAVVRYQPTPETGQGEFVLQDVSRYGTYVDGQRISGAHLLKDGDQIRIGETEMVFKRV